METVQTQPQPQEAPGTPPQEQPVPVLRRSTDDRVVAGVAGGLGRYLGIDPVLIRIAFVLLTVFGGSGVLLYIVGVLAIPEERSGDAVGRAAPGTQWPQSQTMGLVIGAILVGIGGVTLLSRIVPSYDQFLGPVLLIGAGIAVIAVGGRR